MTIRTLSLSALLAAVMATASCTIPQPPTVWQKTGADNELRDADTAACRATANREADREYERRHDFGRTDAFGGQSSWRANMDAYEARKSQAALFAQCMRSRGYHKVRASQP